MKKVSIIVPVYNVEKYLRSCLDSIINQTFKDIEIICVNDGSTDNSLEILKEYSKKDDRIIIINQENKGLSAARNTGIQNADSEFIAFVDSDDWIDLEFIEKLYNAAIKNNCDIAAASIIRKREHSQKYRVHYSEEKVYTTLEEKLNICKIPNCCYVWNKLYKSELVKNNLFKAGAFYEDVFWTPYVLHQAENLVTVPEINYFYRVNNQSIVKKIQSPKKQEDSYRAKKKVIEFFKENNIPMSKKTQTLTKKIKYLFNVPILKIKEFENIETSYLFGILPVRKKTLPVVKSNTFLIWEPCSKSHSEVVPGFAKYLLDLGYEVSVLVNPEHLKSGLFSRFKHKNLFLNKISKKDTAKFFKENSLDNAKGVLVTTAGKLCDNIHFEQSLEHFHPEFDKKKLYLVEHDAQFAIDENLWDKNIITLRKLNYKDADSVVINPHYFGDIKIPDSKNKITNFVMVGSLSNKKGKHSIIINAISELIEKGYKDFKFTIIGKGSLKHIPNKVKKYIDLKGRLPFDKMYSELEKADFLITAYDTNNPRHQFYKTSGTSGSFQLVYGFLKPCIIVEDFASANSFDNENAILYKTESDYAQALIKAIEMSNEDYLNMQSNLQKYVESLKEKSEENFKNLIEKHFNSYLSSTRT